MPSQLNDDFLERMALNLGENQSVDAAQLLATLQPTMDGAEFRRDLIQMKDGWVAGGAGVSGEIKVSAPADRDVQILWFAINNLANAVIRARLSVESRPSVNPFRQFISSLVIADQIETTIIGQADAEGAGAGIRPFTLRIPAGADLIVTITNSVGGPLPAAGSVAWEIMAQELPPTRSWEGANSIVTGTAPA